MSGFRYLLLVTLVLGTSASEGDHKLSAILLVVCVVWALIRLVIWATKFAEDDETLGEKLDRVVSRFFP